ncbi:MAG TPA: hypothetical protein VGB17_19810 [Pyrinomonadaceae bacterium]
MDLLLRRLARHEGAAPASTSSSNPADPAQNDSHRTADGAHLDADELNSYAENALPAAARAHYAAHLADCDQCRKIVIDLTLAANMADKLEGRAATPIDEPSSSWWRSLSALFALPVVRYGVPTFALAAIIAVVFLATKRERESAYVARNERQAQEVNAEASKAKGDEQLRTPAASSGTLNANSAGSSNTGTNAPVAQEATGPSAATTDTANVASSRESASQSQVDSKRLDQINNKPAEPLTATSEVRRDEAERQTVNETARVAQTESIGPAAARPAPAQPAARDDDRFVVKDEASKEKAQEDKSRHEPPQSASNRSDAPAETGGSAAAKSGSLAKIAPLSAAGRRARRSEEAQSSDNVTSGKDAKASAETRRVSGRTFRREGKAWIDTAYNSSGRTTNVSRGSEQYRALMADEPGLRAIAEQLGGEVIAVWKGRAYRIH